MFNEELILRVYLWDFWMGPGLNIFLRDKDALQILECSDSCNEDLLQEEAVYIVFVTWLLLGCVIRHTFIYHISLTNFASLRSSDTAMKTLLIFIMAINYKYYNLKINYPCLT